MKIKSKIWALFGIAAVISLIFWYKFEYPHFTFVDLSVNKQTALIKAEAYLNGKGIDTSQYVKAIVFETDDWPDRYLQKTIGLKAEEEFIKQNAYELFSWRVRFFKEFQKEEYVLNISCKSGGILGFSHSIEDIEPRESLDKESARQKAEEFLRKNCGLDLKEYDFHEEQVKRYEKRVDYRFSWEKRGIYIPWKQSEGGAKLLTGATVSGEEIRSFYKNNLDVPEKFQRYLENQLISGEYLYLFYYIVFIILIISAVYVLLKNRHTLTIQLCKNWFLSLGILFIAIQILFFLNNIQHVIISCPTTTRVGFFIAFNILGALVPIAFLATVFVIPGLSGEVLSQEVFPHNKYISFLHYLKSNFYNRSISVSIILGYICFFILLGLQSIIFNFGQKYLGVWKEWLRLTELSSAYLPVISALIIGISASMREEITFRLFGISWMKRYFKNILLAVILTSLVWGLGHSTYPIFPIWFRAIEVTLLGLFFGLVFVKYGIIPVIVMHYLFDVFWGVSSYILGRSSATLVLSSIFILALPLIFALAAYLANKQERDISIVKVLDKDQEYNLGILINYINSKACQGFDLDIIKEELVSHGWDADLVALAIREVKKI